jgi:hypothetical protein
MSLTPAYIPSATQTDAQAQARATAIGVGVAPRTVPPVYQAAVAANGALPGVVAEYGTVVFAHDDGTLTAAQLTTAIAGLVAQQAADATTTANQQTILANVLARQGQIQAFMTANPTGAVLTAAQTLAVARMLNGLCMILIQQFSSTAGT